MPRHTDLPDRRHSCRVCSLPLSSNEALTRHMKVKHPAEWVNSGRQLTYYTCPVLGCTQLDNNPLTSRRDQHLSRVHGIDPPNMLRTTAWSFLEVKNKDILEMHVAQEARELNELNAKIRKLEYCLVGDNGGTAYYSCHNLDVWTQWRTELASANLPRTKLDLVDHLQNIRNCRNQVGPLYTRPWVVDTREGILDDLETLLDIPHSVVIEDLEEQLNSRDDALDFLEMLLDTSDCGDDDSEMMLERLDDLPDPDNLESLFDPYNLDPDAFEELDDLDEALDHLAEPLGSP